MTPLNQDPARIKLERDLYLALLDLAHIDDPHASIRAALNLAGRSIGAERGYLEVYADGHEPAYTMDTGMNAEDRELAKSRVSRGIIAEALAEGRTVHTPSALLDERFSQRQSVRTQGIEEVVCAPIGSAPILGAVYLTGRSGGGQFNAGDIELLQRLVFHLAPVIRSVLARDSADSDPTQELRRQIHAPDIIGRSQAIAEVLEQVRIVARSKVHVLITGASGTGKSLVARVIHFNSNRRGGPFVHLNCANLPSDLIESELFGAEKGGHSTALEAREGKVAAADGGTLFLDEVAELTLPAQAKLLQLIQEKRYFKIGGNEERRADIRVVTATNANLSEMVSAGRFREDLFYRINVFPVRMPTLAERREDIPLLARCLVERHAKDNEVDPIPLSSRASLLLRSQEWSGNVRELENLLSTALIRAHGAGAQELDTEHFAVRDAPSRPHSYQEATRQFQRSLVHEALEEAKGNAAAAAERLQIARSHLYNLIDIHGLKKRPKTDPKD